MIYLAFFAVIYPAVVLLDTIRHAMLRQPQPPSALLVAAVYAAPMSWGCMIILRVILGAAP